MPKVLMLDPQQIEDLLQNSAEELFNDVIDITKKHGVCFIRFTRADGMVIVHPKYNQKINGVISDA